MDTSPGALLGRDTEVAALERFLGRLSDGSAALLLEGEAGIGKTALLLEASRRAVAGGALLLHCVGAVAETTLTYSALFDLLGDLGAGVVEELPGPQREGLQAALLLRGPRAGPSATADVRAVSAGALTVLRSLTAHTPVVLAIDDLQWLDGPSRRVVDFCLRRLPDGVGVIATARRGVGGLHVTRVRTSDPARSEVCVVGGLSDHDVRRLVHRRAIVPLERRETARIVQLAGGNPFYALELLRGQGDVDERAPAPALPPSLSDVVVSRTRGLDRHERNALLAVASMARPTLSAVEAVVGGDVVAVLAEPERRGLVSVLGDRVHFSHPLLAQGVYAAASSAARRDTHRRLSTAALGVEERARHLAAARMLPEALTALEEAAAHLCDRGAPDAAAEMLELAVELGADRRLTVLAAEHRFDAGDTRAAVRMLEGETARLPPGTDRAAALLLLGEIRCKDDSFPAALRLLEQALGEAAGDERLELMSDLRLAFVLFNLGLVERASDAGHAALARAERLGDDALLAQSLAVTVIVDCALGLGFDEPRLRRSLALQHPAGRTPVELHPGLIATFVYLWNTRFDDARTAIDAVCAQFLERGEEQALAWASFTRVWVESASGDAASTTSSARLAQDRLLMLDTVTGRAMALAARGEAAAYAGRHEESRQACEASLAEFERSGWTTWSWLPRTTLAAVELSQGRAAAAIDALGPLVDMAVGTGLPDPTPGGIVFAADLAEALIDVDRTTEAEMIVRVLEDRGRALDRPWAIATGARCRGLLLAVAGDLDGAERVLERALSAHADLAMPVERARSRLALARVLRRQRRRRAARDLLQQARAELLSHGALLWLSLVDDQLARLGTVRGLPDHLSASEERVAQLAALGLTNRQVAASLAISPKTVEAHLARAYGKLGIHSRAELGALMRREPAVSERQRPSPVD